MSTVPCCGGFSCVRPSKLRCQSAAGVEFTNEPVIQQSMEPDSDKIAANSPKHGVAFMFLASRRVVVRQECPLGARTHCPRMLPARAVTFDPNVGPPSATVEDFTWLPKQYTETENRRPTCQPVSASPILPRWFSNQWLTDALVGNQFLFSII